MAQSFDNGSPIPCIVLGTRFSERHVNDALVRDFVVAHQINVPAGEFLEVNKTKVKVHGLTGSTGTTVGSVQDGGNGSGGDTTGNHTHYHSGLRTQLNLSFWKVDTSPVHALAALGIDVFQAATKTSPKLPSPQSDPDRDVISGQVRDAYAARYDPGCVFYFPSHDAAYEWLLKKNGGSAMYLLYDEVRIIAVNKTFAA